MTFKDSVIELIKRRQANGHDIAYLSSLLEDIEKIPDDMKTIPPGDYNVKLSDTCPTCGSTDFTLSDPNQPLTEGTKVSTVRYRCCNCCSEYVYQLSPTLGRYIKSGAIKAIRDRVVDRIIQPAIDKMKAEGILPNVPNTVSWEDMDTDWPPMFGSRTDPHMFRAQRHSCLCRECGKQRHELIHIVETSLPAVGSEWCFPPETAIKWPKEIIDDSTDGSLEEPPRVFDESLLPPLPDPVHFPYQVRTSRTSSEQRNEANTAKDIPDRHIFVPPPSHIFVPQPSFGDSGPCRDCGRLLFDSIHNYSGPGVELDAAVLKNHMEAWWQMQPIMLPRGHDTLPEAITVEMEYKLRPHSLDSPLAECLGDEFINLRRDVQFGRISWPVCLHIQREYSDGTIGHIYLKQLPGHADLVDMTTIIEFGGCWRC